MQLSVVYVLAACVLFVVASEDPKRKEAQEKCVSRLGASPEDMFVFEIEDPPKTKHQACLGACFLKEYGAMKPDNELVKSVLLEFDEEELLDASPIIRQLTIDVVTHCIKHQSRDKDECVVFQKFMTCVENRIQELDPVKYVQDKCLEIHNGTESERAVMNLDRASANRRESCIGACYYKEFGIMDKNNRFDREKVLQFDETDTPADRRAVTRVVDRCLARQKPEADECDAFKRFTRCLL